MAPSTKLWLGEISIGIHSTVLIAHALADSQRSCRNTGADAVVSPPLGAAERVRVRTRGLTRGALCTLQCSKDYASRSQRHVMALIACKFLRIPRLLRN